VRKPEKSLPRPQRGQRQANPVLTGDGLEAPPVN
jgi:hypothetical protein